jgi:hypothetical protein
MNGITNATARANAGTSVGFAIPRFLRPLA